MTPRSRPCALRGVQMRRRAASVYSALPAACTRALRRHRPSLQHRRLRQLRRPLSRLLRRPRLARVLWLLLMWACCSAPWRTRWQHRCKRCEQT